MKKIHYKCNNCGWNAYIAEAWGDLRPKFCGNKRCKTDFSKVPESLLVFLPISEEIKVIDSTIKNTIEIKSKNSILSSKEKYKNIEVIKEEINKEYLVVNDEVK